MQLNEIIISGIVMLILDAFYLSFFSKFFNNLIKNIQGTPIKFNILGAIVCYALLIFGLNFFIINKKRPIIEAFILGIIIYGVYETTNYTIIDKWDINAVLLDTTWGGILMALTTFITYKFL